MTSVRIVDSPQHPVRLAFAQHLFNAGTVGGEGEPAYSVTAIIPRDHPQIAEIEEAELEAAQKAWDKKAEANLSAIRKAGKSVVKDGDLKANYAGFEGNAFISMRARENQRPTTLGRNNEQVVESDGVIYSGCYAHVIFEVWAQDNQYGKRVNAQVTGVRFSRDGDSFGGGATPASADDFADLSASDDDMLD